MYCKKCGTQNNDSAQFCRSCGAPMGQSPAPGSSPNGFPTSVGRAPSRQGNSSTVSPDTMWIIAAIVAVVAAICLFLLWYSISAYGETVSFSVLDIVKGVAEDFDSLEDSSSEFILDCVLGIGCIVIAVYCLFAAIKKSDSGKAVAIIGVLLALGTLYFWKETAESAAEGASMYAKMGSGFYIYIVAMAVYAVVCYLNKNKS